MNPGGSVKDRAALYIVLDAEARGELRLGGVIVEGTAGNAGIGLVLVGNARGYRTVVVIPQTQSQDSKGAPMDLWGAVLKPLTPRSDGRSGPPWTRSCGHMALASDCVQSTRRVRGSEGLVSSSWKSSGRTASAGAERLHCRTSGNAVERLHARRRVRHARKPCRTSRNDIGT